MYELSVALKYLKPQWRQLSVSIISTISMLVIALVVWLIVVFFSITNGLQETWIQKLTALTAPIRITPTPAYYDSYYHLIDSISSSSDYTSKSIPEKRLAAMTDPYDPAVDEEVPVQWSKPVYNSDGSVKDLVKTAFSAIDNIKGFEGLRAFPYEITPSQVKIRLLREYPMDSIASGWQRPVMMESFITQTALLGSIDPYNTSLSHAILKISPGDLSNILKMLDAASQNTEVADVASLDHDAMQQSIEAFFQHVNVTKLKTPRMGWTIPNILYPDSGHIEGIGVFAKDGRLERVAIPQQTSALAAVKSHLIGFDEHLEKVIVNFDADGATATINNNKVPLVAPLVVEANILLNAKAVPGSWLQAASPRYTQFDVILTIQGLLFEGKIPLGRLEVGEAHLNTEITTPSPFWTHLAKPQNAPAMIHIPGNAEGEGILLPKSFKEGGLFVGDRGYLSYQAPTISSMQEQRIPVTVAGFFDHGIIPIGGTAILASESLTGLIRGSHPPEESGLSSGINVRLKNMAQVDDLKKALQQAFEKEGISPYWKIETYREFPFTKDIIQQLASDKTLFMLIATVIIIVACSNIISMLIILVNDKKVEIGILRSMGATSLGIALIFGICGVAMGAIGSIAGTLVALATLKNLDLLVKLLNTIQGHQAFNPVFYGDHLPNQVSFEALGFVMIVTVLISLFAGIVPALKASMMRPSNILRSE